MHLERLSSQSSIKRLVLLLDAQITVIADLLVVLRNHQVRQEGSDRRCCIVLTFSRAAKSSRASENSPSSIPSPTLIGFASISTRSD